MPRRGLLLFAPAGVLLTLSVASAWAGCSSADSPASGDAGGDVGSSDTSGATGLCVGDKTALEITYCPEHKSFVDLVGACGIECVLAANRHEETPTCVQDCLRLATDGKIGDPCLGCQAGLVACARAYCLGDCASGPSTAKCLTCMCKEHVPDGGTVGTNCYDPFNTCSGLATDYCKQLDAGTFDGFPPPNDGGACEAAADAGDAGPKDAADSGVKDAAVDAPKDAAKDAPVDAPKDAVKDGG
ncbi:MAG: hypothetical protein ABI175_21750 [Polyangiales bacterium]